MASGPTQNYDDAGLGVWRPRPVLAGCVRVLVAVLPAAIAVGLGAAAVRWLPPARLGMHPWLWLALEVLLATGVVLVAGRALRRLLPLTTLLRLSVVFPDRAPSRLAVARRTHSPATLASRGRGRRATAAVPVPDDDAARVLALVAALHAHDRTTFRHSERVQAYSALIGRQLGLSRDEVARLGWAALMHDVGKLEVPLPVLTKAGRPDDDEWAAIAAHPEHGTRIIEPLAAWLGPWADAVGQHHERWDGGGYPRGLAGTDISLAARVVAVADAYDVITSARPYKKPLSATAARAELTRCAGSQFDPEVVRALLAVGLGSLRRVAGPASALAALPGLRAVPLPDLAGAVPVLSSASTSAVVVAALAVATPGLVHPAAAPAVVEAAAAGAVAGAVPSSRPTPVANAPSPSDVPDAADAPGAAEAAGGTDAPGDAGPSPAATPPTALAQAPGAEVVAPASGAGAAAPAPGTPAGPAGAPAPGRPSPGAVPPRTTPSPSQPPAAPPAPLGTPCERARSGATDLRGADLGACDLSGLTLTGSWRGVSLHGATLTGATLVDLDLRDARLNGTILRDARLTRVRLTDADLNGADLSGAVITDSRFEDATLLGATFARATITGSRFEGARTNPSTFAGATVTDSSGL